MGIFNWFGDKKHDPNFSKTQEVDKEAEDLIRVKENKPEPEDPFAEEKKIDGDAPEVDYIDQEVQEKIKLLERLIETEKNMGKDNLPYLWEERKFFVIKRRELLKFHPNTYILIKDQAVHGVFDKAKQAIVKGLELFDDEPFLVHKVCADKRAETVHYIKHMEYRKD